MNSDDIFARAEKEAPILGDFFKFINIGDRVSGTFVDLLEGVDGYGNDQYVVILRNNNTSHRVSVRKNHIVLVDQLKQVRFGQIIGFSFKEERDSKVKGGAKSKIINLAQVPGMVDDQWIKDKLEVDAKYGISPESSLHPKFDTIASTPKEVTVPFESSPVVAAIPVAAIPVAATPKPVAATPKPVAAQTVATLPASPIFTTIRNLAVKKGIVQEDSTPEATDAVIETITGLKMSEENTNQIIMKLSATL